MGELRRMVVRPRESRVRLWMFNIHLYTGLALTVLTTVIGISGSVIVYKPEMERLSAGAMSTVQPGEHVLKISQLYELAQRAIPEKKVERLYIWGGPTAAYSFRASVRDRQREYVYVDQYRGVVLGRYPMDGTWLQWVYDLHDDILMGRAGLVTNGIGALLLALMCISGLVIWWPGIHRVAFGFLYHRRAKWKGQVYDLHKLAGVFSLIILGIIAITGASYSFPEMYRSVVSASVATVQSTPQRARVSVDEVYHAAAEAVPGAAVTVLTWPAGPRSTFVARERLATDWSRLGDNYVYIDPYSGGVLRSDIARHVSRGNRIMLAMSPLHYGTFGGHFTRIVWIVMGFVPGVLAVTGFLIWWNRVVVKRVAAGARERLGEAVDRQKAGFAGRTA